ncbi:MAG: hypothetical protein ACRD2O_00150 [Terriglobia bacterium]
MSAPLTPGQAAQAEARASKEGYVHRVLVGVDQAANVLLGGKPDETISARSRRAAARGDWIGKAMCWWLGKLQANHGMKAEAGDLERASTVAQTESQALSEQEKKP